MVGGPALTVRRIVGADLYLAESSRTFLSLDPVALSLKDAAGTGGWYSKTVRRMDERQTTLLLPLLGSVPVLWFTYDLYNLGRQESNLWPLLFIFGGVAFAGYEALRFGTSRHG